MQNPPVRVELYSNMLPWEAIAPHGYEAYVNKIGYV